MASQVIHNLTLSLRFDLTILINTIQQIRRTDVGSHDKNCILKVNCTSLRICDTAIIQYLQQYVKHIRMCFLNLIEKYNTVWFTADCLSKLATLLISYISRRRSNQSGYRILLHVLTHINSDHILFIIKQILCQSFGKLCLTYTCRTKEQEGTDRFGRILDAGFGTKDCICNPLHTFILAYNSLVKLIFQSKEFGSLAFCQSCYRNTGPSGNDPCDLIISNCLMNQTSVTFFDTLLFDFQLLL